MFKSTKTKIEIIKVLIAVRYQVNSARMQDKIEEKLKKYIESL